MQKYLFIGKGGGCVRVCVRERERERDREREREKERERENLTQRVSSIETQRDRKYNKRTCAMF